MPLLNLWKADKSSILKMTIEQIVSIAGDGKLLDNSPCQQELRQYLNEVSTDSLAEYASYCLDNAFIKSGLLLQDVVNELGRRLEYIVENGRYQGVKNEIGFDGIWGDGKKHSIVIEVKTTDAFSISLDTVVGYRNALINSGRITDESSVLIIVGRTDTGGLEAQVRGSRHAWHIRIIGIESLVQLVRIKESIDSQETVQKIKALLVPVEYTRIDELVGVVFAATKDVEGFSDDIVSEHIVLEDVKESEDSQHYNEKTSSEIITETREKIIAAVSTSTGSTLIKKTRAMFWSSDHKIRVACTISKLYESQGAMKYWYAYHPSWDAFLSGGDSSHLALGCVDLSYVFLLPLNIIQAALPNLHVTQKTDDKKYWHIKIIEQPEGSFFLQVPAPGINISLIEYMLPVC